jgi:hypothetical protein
MLALAETVLLLAVVAWLMVTLEADELLVA